MVPIRPAVALAIALLLLGCGYRPVDASRSPLPGARAIEIRIFENRSAEPGFERILADALLEEFARRGQLAPRVKPGGDSPVLALGGVIREVRVAASALSSVALVLESELEVHLDVRLVSPERSDPVWSDPDLVVRERFLESADPQVARSHKEQALLRIAAEVAGRIHDGIAQGL